MPAGRPTDYSPELTDEFSRRVATGRSVQSVSADEDMPAETTVYRWRIEKPEFREKIADAREERKEASRDKMLSLGDKVLADLSLDPQRVNAAINAIDKAERLMSPKTRVEVSGPNGGPIQTDDVSAIGGKAAFIGFALRVAAEKLKAEAAEKAKQNLPTE